MITRRLDIIRESVSFDLSSYLGNNNFIVRTYNKEKKQNVLSKITLEDPMVLSSTFMLDKQGDGIFSTDGSLNTDPTTKCITYVYYHCNEFIKLDSNLNLLFRNHTIDTNFHENLKISTIKSNNTRTFAEPPKTVNKYSAVNGKWLFVNSSLRASNEPEESAKNNSVIDVYSLFNGKYHFSFYLPDYKNLHLSGLYVSKNTLLAFYGSYVFLYSIKF